MSLSAQIRLTRGELTLDARLAVPDGATLALVGPNGAGKSTLLHALAGLLPIPSGTVELDGRTLDGGGEHVPPEARGVGVVFQDPLLFPHLSAADNVAYGLRARGVERGQARATAERWLSRVGLAECGERRPEQLSGGQAQRVALARALATEPRLLLLDEPLAAVDVTARADLRRELRERLAEFGGSALVVAHDPLDAFALAEHVAVLEAGSIVQVGTTAEICARPRSSYVADLVGLNLFRGVGEDGLVRLEGGGRLVVASAPDGPLLAALHPRAVALFRERPDGSPRNVWRSAVAAVETAVDRLRVRFAAPIPLVAEVTHAAHEELGLAVGEELWVAIKATEITSYPA